MPKRKTVAGGHEQKHRKRTKTAVTAATANPTRTTKQPEELTMPLPSKPGMLLARIRQEVLDLVDDDDLF